MLFVLLLLASCQVEAPPAESTDESTDGRTETSAEITDETTDEVTYEPTKLSTPTGLKQDGGTVVWDSVENASYYSVMIDDAEYSKILFNRYTLPSEFGKFTVKVKAVGNGVRFSDSEWSESIVYEKAKPIELKYKLLEDGSGYEVSRMYTDPNKGVEGFVYIPDTYNSLPVKRIADYAFCKASLDQNSTESKKNTVTTSFRLPAYLESIGEAAFSYCVSITEIEIPDTVKEIGMYAFDGCAKLEKANIPTSLTEIPTSMFRGTAIKSIYIHDNITVIRSGAFSGTKLENIDLPAGLTMIESAAFKNTQLTAVTFPESVKIIRTSAFSNCEKLTSVEFLGEIDYCGNEAFVGSPIPRVEVNGFVIILGNILEKYVGSAEVVDDFPPQIKYIAAKAFAENTTINTLVIPGNVKLIGDFIITKSFSLKKLILLDGITNIPDQAFETYSNALNSIKLSELRLPNTLESMGERAVPLSAPYMVIPKSVKKLMGNSMPSVKIYYYMGTLEEWGKIDITPLENSGGLPPQNNFEKSEIYFYSEAKPAGEGRYWHYVDGVPTVWGE